MKTEQAINEKIIIKAIEIAKHTNTQDIAKVSAKALARKFDIQSKIAYNQQNLQKTTNEYEWCKEKLSVELEEIQSKCLHESTTYYPDASGNNDSSTICDICGKEL